MSVGHSQPAEQVGHQLRHPVGRRCHVDHLASRHYPNAAVPISARLINQAGHQNLVRLQQVLFCLWFPGIEAVIGSQGVFHLLHLAGRGDDPFTFQNRGDLLFTQGVALDGQRAVDGTDAVDASQPQRPCLVGEHGQPSDGLADGCDPVQNLGGNGVGRLVGAHKFTVQLALSCWTSSWPPSVSQWKLLGLLLLQLF